MGFYIETSANHGKAREIAAKYNGEILEYQPVWKDIPTGKGVVVVLDNGPFEAAGFAYCEDEFKAFTRPGDSRYKEFVLLDYAVAAEASGYSE